ncbi:hypothetical protein [Citrobacter portucalensis]|uniref:hypothetical protein n=1 Tax=Citrobacter portucalensis TaxID=1639133 RepID=UPI0039FC5F63
MKKVWKISGAVMLVIVVVGISVKYKMDADQKEQEHHWLLRDNVSAAEYAYASAEGNYSQCAMTDWGSAEQTNAACYSLKQELDDAHKELVSSKEALLKDTTK